METLLAVSLPKLVIITIVSLNRLLNSDFGISELTKSSGTRVLELVCYIECPLNASIILMGNCFVIDKLRWLHMTVNIS
jgi:hypothetical protein